MAGCFVLTVLRMSCSCKCSVVSPHGALGWSVAFFDSGNSISYSLTFCVYHMHVCFIFSYAQRMKSISPYLAWSEVKI